MRWKWLDAGYENEWLRGIYQFRPTIINGCVVLKFVKYIPSVRYQSNVTSTKQWALPICMDKPVRIFYEKEQ